MPNLITLGQPLPGEKYVAEKRRRKKNKLGLSCAKLRSSLG
jgi:hypothetical protein